ncbi:MAG: LuxR C-terminal-related transcriptional regulator [Dehalococcoidia bacterium]
MDRVLGLLAHTMGNLDQAVKHFEDALAFCRKAGYRPELAWTCCDYAEALLQSNSSGNRPKAISLLQESSNIAEDLGMRPLVERVTALQERSELRPDRDLVYPDGLTQREVEVIRLIASGMTDREIADELYISIRTVGYHVGNILNKTACSNRAEAATYASQNRLL